jgi:predicted DCC family thiol-disulfide oxidoreductase YuxK
MYQVIQPLLKSNASHFENTTNGTSFHRSNLFGQMNTKPIILFDGVCNLCNGAVNFVIKRDKSSLIRFAALQSQSGQHLLEQYHLSTGIFNSFVLIEAGIVYTRSTAALKVCKKLTSFWPLMYGFIIVPKFIRDSIYNWIAKNRFRWFGKTEQCMIPAPGIMERFLP